MDLAENPAEFISSSASVSDKIRALDAAGYPRAEIARMLGKRYQHVRNVLEADKAKVAGPSARPPVESRASKEPFRVGNFFRLNVEDGGKLQLPAAVLEALGLQDGRVVLADLDGESFTLMSSRESMRRARAMIPQWRPGDPLWSEELIAERRREAAKEDQGG